MLHRLENLIGMTIEATDGEIGKIKDIYFDDQHWAARFFVVDTGGWFEDRRVLISPLSIESLDWSEHLVVVTLNRQQVKDSPKVDTARPVSRQHEIELFNYYGYPSYWSGPLVWGMTPYPILPVQIPPSIELEPKPEKPAADPHLRSAREVIGYHIHASDDSIGHVEDFLVDQDNWSIRYLIINTRNWWPGKYVIVPPQWIKDLDWAERSVTVGVSRSQVKNAHEYDPAVQFSRDLESNLYAQYNQPGYWE